VERQVAIVYAGTNGYLDDLPVTAVREFETGLYAALEKDYADLMHDLRAKYELTDAIEAKLKKAIEAFKADFTEDEGNPLVRGDTSRHSAPHPVRPEHGPDHEDDGRWCPRPSCGARRRPSSRRGPTRPSFARCSRTWRRPPAT
jgi:hypothetical protein